MAKFLIVDDEEDHLKLLRRLLGNLGHSVVGAAYCGLDALVCLRQSPGTVDAIISDYDMPGGMNGLDLHKAVRHLAPDLPFLLVSGTDFSQAELARMLVPIMKKPYTPDELETALNALLSSPTSSEA